MTPYLVLNDLAAIVRQVSQSNLWIARGLRQPDAPSNPMRRYARLGVQIEQVGAVRARLHQRMVRQTPRAPQLIARALAIYDNEVERARVKQSA